MNTNYGQAAILTPSDYFFARDGIAAEGTINQEQMIVADVIWTCWMSSASTQRDSAADLIKDAYDNVVHFSDYKGRSGFRWMIRLRLCWRSRESSECGRLHYGLLTTRASAC